MIFAVLLLISAAILLIYNTNENNRVEKENLKAVTELENIFEQKQNEKQTDIQESTGNTTNINIDGNNYIGIVYIPVLNNLTLPVIDECNKPNLKKSICKYSGSIESGNFVIAGHNYKTSFGKLTKLAVGNIAYFKDIKGTVYKYRCKEIKVLTPKQVKEMKTGDWDLTLFTCTPNNINRLTCRFELI